MKKMITSLALGVLPFFLSAQILVDEIHIACGNHFFNEINTHRQAAMLVRGIFCGDSYFWSPISAGDTIQEIAYRGEDLFTGVCIDLDTAGNVMGRYTFQNGLIQKLEEFYATGEVYQGKHGLSLRLDGLEYGINDNARNRAVVIHGADYVSEKFANAQGRLGRSLGCPAVPYAIHKDFINLIKDKSCLFIYHPSRTYLAKSKLVS